MILRAGHGASLSSRVDSVECPVRCPSRFKGACGSPLVILVKSLTVHPCMLGEAMSLSSCRKALRRFLLGSSLLLMFEAARGDQARDVGMCLKRTASMQAVGAAWCRPPKGCHDDAASGSPLPPQSTPAWAPQKPGTIVEVAIAGSLRGRRRNKACRQSPPRHGHRLTLGVLCPGWAQCNLHMPAQRQIWKSGETGPQACVLLFSQTYGAAGASRLPNASEPSAYWFRKQPFEKKGMRCC